MDMGFAATWLRQMSPPPASRNHFNHCISLPAGCREAANCWY